MVTEFNFPNLKLFAGVTWDWTESAADYPAPDNVLSVLLKLSTNPVVTIQATAEGTAHRFQKAASTTSNLPSGDYAYQIIAKNGVNVSLLASGTVHIYPLLSSSSEDPRGYWTQIADLLRKAYKNMAGREFTEVTINGKTVRYDRAQLLKELNEAESRSRQETVDNKTTKKILVYY